MKSFLTFAIIGLFSLLTIAAHAADGDMQTAAPKAASLPPPDLAKARQNLAKIQAIVHEKNPQFVNSVSSNLTTADWYVTNSITLSLMVRGKIYNELGVDLGARETSLGIDRVTSATIAGQVKVNGYELVKKTLSSRDGNPSDEAKAQNLESGRRACERIKTADQNDMLKNASLAESYLDCALNYYLLKSNSFSEFLISVKPIAKQFKTLVNDAYYNELKAQAGPWGRFLIYYWFTGNTFDVCTASIWDPLCLGREYINISANYGTLGLSQGNAGLYITKDKLEFSLSIYSFQKLASLLAGDRQSSSGVYIPFSDVKDYVIRQLAAMSDQEIETNAKEISDFIDTYANELNKLGIH